MVTGDDIGAKVWWGDDEGGMTVLLVSLAVDRSSAIVRTIFGPEHTFVAAPADLHSFAAPADPPQR